MVKKKLGRKILFIFGIFFKGERSKIKKYIILNKKYLSKIGMYLPDFSDSITIAIAQFLYFNLFDFLN